jgi:iron complex outermembrane recepter protein
MTKYVQKLVQITPIFKPIKAIAPAIIAPSAINIIAFAALSSLSGFSLAQATQPAESKPTTEQQLPALVITAPARNAQIQIGGQEIPLNQAPVSAAIIGSEQIKSSGAQRLADVFKFDASISDAYNTAGYIDYATVRGFLIDNKLNIRRDGLPISGDTSIGLANKERIEILKGTSGIQAGTSAPGGLVNYIVKRPTSKPLHAIDISLDSHGQLSAALDLSGRFGADHAQGYRLNFAADRLNAAAPRMLGSRRQLALALDSRLGRDGLLEAEFEWSRQSQPTLPGLSVLGGTGVLPAPNPKLNLNQQSWSQPTEFEGLTGSLRYTQALGEHWQWSAHLGSQRLRTDDRAAFAFGCGNAGSGSCNAFYDNGDVDIYDYRSEGERRRQQAAQFKLDGTLHTGTVQHNLSFGLLQSSARIHLLESVYQYAGTVNLANPAQPVAPNTLPNQSANQQRETRTELFASDMLQWSPALRTWLGLRHTRLQRSDALQNTSYPQNFTTPWLAASYVLGAHTLYASHGQGIETETAPAINTANPGAVLPVRRSRQTEIGIKSQTEAWFTQATLFRIERPMSNLDACAFMGNLACLVQPDGSAVHQGLELSTQWQNKLWQLSASATGLHARRQASQVLALNGLQPTNVPTYILRLNAAYQFAPDWQVAMHLSHEGKRQILPDNSLQLPAWTRIDASLKWDIKLGKQRSTWRLSIDNLLNKRFYRESPHQFGHAYLFPATPRTVRLSASFSL